MITSRISWRVRVVTIAAALFAAQLSGMSGSPASAATDPVSRTATQAAGCDGSVCLFSATNFGGTAFDTGFPSMTCTTAPFAARSATNDIVFHVELYSDPSCQVFDFFLESGTSNASLPSPARSYKTFICGQECLTSAEQAATRDAR